MMLAMVLGVVGKIGSGKSYFVNYIKNKYQNCDIIVFSCDDIAKELLNSNKTSYKRKDIVPHVFFTNEKLQESVRNTLHPEVFNYIKDEIDKQKSSLEQKKTIYVVESALPNEIMYEICDKVVYIKSSYDNSYSRLKLSRSYTDSEIKLIYNSQLYYEKFYDTADFIIENNGDRDSFELRINEVMNEICFVCE